MYLSFIWRPVHIWRSVLLLTIWDDFVINHHFCQWTVTGRWQDKFFSIWKVQHRKSRKNIQRWSRFDCLLRLWIRRRFWQKDQWLEYLWREDFSSIHEIKTIVTSIAEAEYRAAVSAIDICLIRCNGSEFKFADVTKPKVIYIEMSAVHMLNSTNDAWS